MGLPIVMVICLFQAQVATLAGWENRVAERMSRLPNPYEVSDRPEPETFPKAQTSWITPPTAPPGERRYFEMEDSADWMGLRLGRRATLGLQVEFVGPAEEPKPERKMTNLEWDPFDPRYVQTTFGVRFRF